MPQLVHSRPRRIRATLTVLGLFAAGLAGITAAAPAASAGVGRLTTPPMGWNDWNAFGCSVSATLIEKTAQAMVDDGMAAAGYKYVNIDDCWMDGSQYARSDPLRATAGRVDGHLVADPTNFPDGIKPVADYVHSLGLRLGIYESAGTTTCQGLAGSYGHELTDARDFAAWGVDYVKYDNCGTVAGTADDQDEYIARYKAMGDALKQASRETGHRIVYSVCEWGNYQPWTWASDRAEADLWRTTGDIQDTWASTVSLFKQNIALSSYSHPDAYNDPDMLEIGNGGQTTTEYQSQFSLWSMMAAPLISGTPIADAGGQGPASATTLSIYENNDVIAVDQDPLGKAASVYSHQGKEWTLVRPLANGDEAVLLFNEADTATTQAVPLSAVLPRRGKGDYEVRDLWTHHDSRVADVLHANVAAHGVAMFRVARRSSGAGGTTGNVVLSATSSGQYVETGTSTTLTETVFNDGSAPIRSVAISTPSLPSGWTVTPVRRVSGTVRAESSSSGTWTVHVPTGADPGSYEIDATVRYRAQGHGRTTSSTLSLVVPPATPTGTAYLSDLDPVSSTGAVNKDQQVITGSTHPLKVAGTTYAKGLGVETGSDVRYYLGGKCSSLSAVAGVDDNASAFSGTTPTATVHVLADGAPVYEGTLTKGTAVPVTKSISGAQVLEMVVDPGTGFGTTPVDWADAQVTCG